MRALLDNAIAGYQRRVSPMFARRCRFHPTCSQYAREAIREFGAARGMILAAWRVVRCNPWNPGGVDHPGDQRVFRS